MIIRRLTWAGLELQTPDATAVVDLLGGRPSLSEYAGDPTEDLLAPVATQGTVVAAAVTHLHSDHFDVEACGGRWPRSRLSCVRRRPSPRWARPD